jgi:hypothetical protein
VELSNDTGDEAPKHISTNVINKSLLIKLKEGDALKFSSLTLESSNMARITACNEFLSTSITDFIIALAAHNIVAKRPELQEKVMLFFG